MSVLAKSRRQLGEHRPALGQRRCKKETPANDCGRPARARRSAAAGEGSAAPALAKTPIADYARYYTALIDLRKGEAVRARDAFHALVTAKPAGVLGEWALAGEASAAEQSGDAAVRAVENQPWDPSVKSLVAFPQILQTMGEKPDWVQNLGDAFLA